MTPEPLLDRLDARLRMVSEHVQRLCGRVAHALAGPLETDDDLAKLQLLLDATALELDAPERPLAETMRNGSNEIESIRFTVSRQDWPSALELRLRPLRSAVGAPPSA
jgi:hypothetical protein